jgi:hypothetical protein
MTPWARQVIFEVAELRGVDPKKIVGQCRHKKVFRARMEVARRLSARGYSTSRIGAILDKNHTTIVFYLGRGKKQPSKPLWRTPKIRHLCFVKPRPVPAKRKFYLAPYAGAYWPEYDWKERPCRSAA